MPDLRTLMNIFAGGLGSFANVSRGDVQQIWEDTQNYALRLLQVATERWVPFYAEAHACHVQELRRGVPFPCPSSGILLCDACTRPVCISHAQLDALGNGTCFPCIAELIALKRSGGATQPGPNKRAEAQPPHEAERVSALRALGLKDPVTIEEIAQAHRSLAAKYHPDRARTPAQRARMAEKSVKVNSAYATLKKIYEGRAA